MRKKRMRKKTDDGLFSVQAMVRDSLSRLWNEHPDRIPSLAEIFVDLLNTDGNLGISSKKRIEDVIRLLRLQAGYRSQFVEAMHTEMRVAEDLYCDSYVKVSFQLNEVLRKYSFTPQFDLAESGPMFFFLSAEAEEGSSPDEQNETAAIMCALQLADRGQIDMVRQCSCGTFFVPRRIDMHHCSTACRVTQHQSTEEFKAKRRKADRERYRLHRDGKVKQVQGGKNVTHKAR